MSPWLESWAQPSQSISLLALALSLSLIFWFHMKCFYQSFYMLWNPSIIASDTDEKWHESAKKQPLCLMALTIINLHNRAGFLPKSVKWTLFFFFVLSRCRDNVTGQLLHNVCWAKVHGAVNASGMVRCRPAAHRAALLLCPGALSGAGKSWVIPVSEPTAPFGLRYRQDIPEKVKALI